MSEITEELANLDTASRVIKIEKFQKYCLKCATILPLEIKKKIYHECERPDFVKDKLGIWIIIYKKVKDKIMAKIKISVSLDVLNTIQNILADSYIRAQDDLANFPNDELTLKELEHIDKFDDEVEKALNKWNYQIG